MGVGVDTVLTLRLVDALRARRLSRSQERSPEPAEEEPLSDHQLAASVLHVFDCATVRTRDGRGSEGASYDRLFASSAPAVGWPGMRSLHSDLRIRGLKQLGGRAGIEAMLAANPDRVMTGLQRLFEQAVAGNLGNLASLSFGQLESMKQLYDWHLDEVVEMPDREAHRTAHRQRASVARFEHLVDANFVGRATELQVLRDHVGVVAPSAWARVRAFFSSERRDPLFLAGPGGAGKTAILGRFLMEHVEAPQNGWFPFAYLAFDSESVDVREPFTLLVESAAQLAAQVQHNATPESRAVLDESIADYRRSVERYRDNRGRLGLRASRVSSQQDRISSLVGSEDELAGQFAHLLAQVSAEAGAQQSAKTVPVLIVFDTFEEVIYRAREDLIGFWRMLDLLADRFPPLRIILAGRAGVEADPLHSDPTSGYAPPAVTQYALPELSSADAMLLLERLGVQPRERVEAIAQQVGGNPLTLHLAARVASEEGGTKISGLQTKRFGFLAVSPALIRGQLYRRILDHIHDEEVRALAHPGMVLRRVTPAIIKEVLAPLCGISDVGERAEDLFTELRHEHALVRLEGDGSLRYREEVRGPVLQLLKQDKPEQVRDIHERAVAFYRHSEADPPDPSQRAEELYHRLMLEQEEWELNDRWLSGVEPYLATALDEIPLAQKIWLAQRMSIEMPPEVHAQADLTAWERLTGHRALQMVRYNEFSAAASLLETRTERTPDSPLFALEARILIALGRSPEAVQLLDHALSHYPPTADRGRSAELLWLYAQALGHEGRSQDSLAALDTLLDVAADLPRCLPLVQTLTELVARLDDVDPQRSALLRERLAQALLKLPIADVMEERSLVRLALVRLGPDFPLTASRLLGYVYDDWAYLVKSDQIDLARLVVPALAAFAESSVAEYARLAEQCGDLPAPAVKLVDELGALLSQLREPDSPEAGLGLDTAALRGFYMLLGAEKATLAGATLAGIADSRPDWEESSSAEATL